MLILRYKKFEICFDDKYEKYFDFINKRWSSMAKLIKPKQDLESYTVKLNFLFISVTVQLHQNALN